MVYAIMQDKNKGLFSRFCWKKVLLFETIFRISLRQDANAKQLPL
jgi:hypothetical protein